MTAFKLLHAVWDGCTGINTHSGVTASRAAYLGHMSSSDATMNSCSAWYLAKPITSSLQAKLYASHNAIS